MDGDKAWRWNNNHGANGLEKRPCGHDLFVRKLKLSLFSWVLKVVDYVRDN